VAVVGVKDVRSEPADQAGELPQRPGVRGDGPREQGDADAVRGCVPGQLRVTRGGEDLVDVSAPGKFARQQPDLLLAAAPFPTRADL
jgi:hypothetical protein